MDNKQFAYLAEFYKVPTHTQSVENCLPLIVLIKSGFCGYYYYLVNL